MPKPWYKSAEPLESGTSLQVGVWYWSPLWDKSHLVGRRPEYTMDTSWCGRALDYARDNPAGLEVGGLWTDVRTSDGIHCADCRRYEKEKT